MRTLFKKLLDLTLDLTLNLKGQERVAAHVYHRARGENNDLPESNGEYRLLAQIKKVMSMPAVFFDIGANHGDWSLEAARGTSGRLTIYAFEPAPATYQVLKSRLANANPEVDIHPEAIALSDGDGIGDFYVASSTAGSNSLHQRIGSEVRVMKVEKVPLARGETFCRERNISRIQLMKIDTEGHELTVLRGFGEMLVRGEIDCIQFEYGGTWIDAKCWLRDAFVLLESSGYRLGKILSDGIFFPEGYSQKFENFAYANWVAVRRELVPKFGLSVKNEGS